MHEQVDVKCVNNTLHFYAFGIQKKISEVETIFINTDILLTSHRTIFYPILYYKSSNSM